MDQFDVSVWKYFTPCHGTFWKWSDDQATLLWKNGTTLAFRDELEALFGLLADDGLINFESILLVLSACRKDAVTKLDQIHELIELSAQPMKNSLAVWFTNVVERLKRVTELPEELKKNIAAKRAILSLIGETGSKPVSAATARACLEFLRLPAVEDSLHLNSLYRTQPKSTADWIWELRNLNDGLASITETSVRLRLTTGLVAEVKPAPLETFILPPVEEEPEAHSQTVRDLIRELEDDPEHSGLMRLARRLMSVVSLPRPLSAPEDQPVGGVSDITNRGEFDRLLLSELAQDTDILMTRVALNEALYIRRETPPAFPPRERLVLIDSGMRMWGLPRVYATAVALAFAAMQDEQHQTRIFRAEGSRVVPVQLNSKAGLESQLAVLELPVHPGEALEAFVAEAQGRPADLLIITAHDVLIDPEFRQTVQKQAMVEFYMASVNRDGRFELTKRTRQGERMIRQAQLELEKLLASSTPRKTSIQDAGKDLRLPAILKVLPFPLRLYHPIQWAESGTIWQSETNLNIFERERARNDIDTTLLTVTHDRRLMLWSGNKYAGRQLTDRLPPGRLLWHTTLIDDSMLIRTLIGTVEIGRFFLVTVDFSGTYLDIVPLESNSERVIGTAYHAGLLYLVQKNQVWAYHGTTGKLIKSSPVDANMTWLHGRFFRKGHEVFGLLLDSDRFEFRLLPQSPAASYYQMRTVFNSQAIGLPVAFTHHSKFVPSGFTEPLRFRAENNAKTATSSTDTGINGRENPKSIHIALDGDRVVLSDFPNQAGPPVKIVVNLRELTVRESYENHFELLNPVSKVLNWRDTLRNKIQSVAIYQDRLLLITKRQLALQLCLDTVRQVMHLRSLSKFNNVLEREFSCRQELVETASPKDAGYDLRVATWKDGSRIFLDSRGLLHLQSSDTTLPEMTLVLNDSNVAGWSDTQKVWGQDMFLLPDPQRMSANQAYEEGIDRWIRRIKQMVVQ